MHAYRLYLYSKNGRLVAPGIVITAESDNDAIAKAERGIDCKSGDLLDDLRLIKQFEPKKK